jgi:hypothetical protein
MRSSITLVVALASLVPATLFADGMPPATGKGPGKGTPEGAATTSPNASKVTMSDLAADAPDQYTVVKGDTLWGISGKFLKDPWKWPQIWQMNREQIKDPHWIYPGDVIRLDRSASGGPSLSLAGREGGGRDSVGPSGGTEEQAVANTVRLDPRVRVEPLQLAIPSIPGSVIGPFLTQPLVVEEDGLANAPTILATEESRVIIGQGDTAYADRIGTGASVNWQVFRPGAALRDPDSGEVLGYEAKYVGDARVRRYGNPTTLEIVKARQEVNRGDKLTPAREANFPTYVPRAPDKPIKGAIMSVDGGVSEVGQFQIITINRGARDGLEVGHVLAAYRRGAEVGSQGVRSSTYFDSELMGKWFSGFGIWGSKPNYVVAPPNQSSYAGDGKSGAVLTGSTVTLPDERTGLVFVFRVFEKMSYAMVMRANKPMYVGDYVQTP